METPLEQQPDLMEEMLAHAHYHACDAQAQAIDVANMAFPTGHKAPSDEMLSAVAQKLKNIILGLENSILNTDEADENGQLVTWDLLLQSGFLKEAALIDFILARFSEDKLEAALAANGEISLAEQLPAQLLSDGNDILADAAQSMLAGHSILRRSPELLWRELPSELLHQAIWRVVAALQILSGAKNDDHIKRAKTILSRHDESLSIQGAARKIVHFYGYEDDGILLNPQTAGLPIFTAALSHKLGLDQDHILRLMDGHSSIILAVLLRAANIGRDEAMAIICLFKGFNLTPFEVTSFDNNFENLDIDRAGDIVTKWGMERARHISFPALNEAAPK